MDQPRGKKRVRVEGSAEEDKVKEEKDKERAEDDKGGWSHVGTVGEPLPKPWSPYAVAAGSFYFYVTDTSYHRVVFFSMQGKYVGQWGQQGTSESQFNNPTGIAVGRRDGIETTILATIYQDVPELAAFPPGILPICVAYLGKECVYVVDSGNHRMQMFDGDGGFIRMWGRPGKGPGEFVNPRRCCVAENTGCVYVTSTLICKIQCFDENGNWKNTFYFDPLRLNSNLPLIEGVHVSSDTHLLYVTDRNNSNIGVFQLDGTQILRKCVPNDSIDLISHNHHLYILSIQGKCIDIMRTDGDTLVATWGKNLFSRPTSIAYSSEYDRIIVADEYRVAYTSLSLGYSHTWTFLDEPLLSIDARTC